MSLEILPELTKDYVLQKVSQEDIFEHFTGIPVVIGERVCSPFREDKNPTCEFYYTRNNHLKFRDFSGDFWGDCFDAVVRVSPHILNTRGRNFKLILEEIAKAFAIHRYAYNINAKPRTFKKQRSDVDKHTKIPDELHVVRREWMKTDMVYWSKIGRNITPELLQYFHIYPVQSLWVNGKIRYSYRKHDPAYAYYSGRFPDNSIKWRIYFPKRTEVKFYTNNSVVQGIHQVVPALTGCVTKSLKDIVSLYSFGITAIAPPGEVVPLPSKAITKLKRYTHYQFSLFDYDNAGIRGAINLRNEHNIVPIFLAEKPFARKKGYRGAKDISDYCVKYGVIQTEDLIKYKFDQYQKDIELIQSIEFNQFKPYRL